MNVEPISIEKHYSIKEVAERWGLSENTVRDLFRDEADVMRIDRPKTRGKRAYSTLRIPASVVQRVHRRMRIAA
jgi:AraC-like DNA-binding protein